MRKERDGPSTGLKIGQPYRLEDKTLTVSVMSTSNHYRLKYWQKEWKDSGMGVSFESS